jgi:DNA-binding transcriptional LysR family regulator
MLNDAGAAMDRFDAMQAFARVVEAGSFTRAADTLHMSKTSVTQLVQQLEARLRVKLLNRTTRQVKVTADGAAYYERVLRVLADVDDAESSLSSASASPRGRLRVDVPSPLARMILVPALPQFHARFPEIQLDMGVSDRMVDVIGDNVDCVVRGGELADQSLAARRVADLQLGVYAAPAYLERAGTPSHPRDLESTRHHIVGFLWARTGKPFPYTMHRGDEHIKVHGRHLFAFDDGNAYLAAGLAGLGILWLPDYMARQHVGSGELAPLFKDWRLDPMPLYVAYTPKRHVSAKLRVFIEWVAELMAQHAPVAGPALKAQPQAAAPRPRAKRKTS